MIFLAKDGSLISEIGLPGFTLLSSSSASSLRPGPSVVKTTAVRVAKFSARSATPERMPRSFRKLEFSES